MTLDEIPVGQAYVTTASGRKIDLVWPSPAEISIEDIATALARIPRWCGHTRRRWTVAEHSVLVSALLPPELALQGLLHDAAKAFTNDIPTPLKRLLPNLQVIESRLLGAIWVACGLVNQVIDITYMGAPVSVFRPLWDPRLTEADDKAFAIEDRDLRSGNPGTLPMHERLAPLENEAMSRKLFLERHRQLTNDPIYLHWRRQPIPA